MKKFTLLVASVSLLALASCSSMKKDYTVLDASEKSPPKWIEKPESIDASKEAKKYRYFVDHNENPVQRLCEKGAKARADAKIAAEISQFITNTYAEATTETETYSEEALAKEAKAYVVGSQLAASYWEKRSYEVDLGAAEDKKVYHCFADVRIDKTTLDKATTAAIRKFVVGVPATAKENALKSLESAKEAFVSGPQE